MTRQLSTPLADHVDLRLLTDDESKGSPTDRNLVVQLDPDHPGFRDAGYRERRNRIAEIAMSYQPGSPIPDAAYTREEHGVWRAIWEALAPAQRQHACAEYLLALQQLQFDPGRIPQLSAVNERVHAISGFRLEPVAGLVEPRVFLESLAHGVFLCTQYIRHPSAPFYTPEPDVVHEIIGHGVTLACPQLAELNRFFGAAVKRTTSAHALDKLARIYWFTIEFGVLWEAGTLKAYGTGLLSSSGELEAMHKAQLEPLELETVARQEYDPTRYQPVLFYAESFTAMYDLLHAYLIGWR